MAKPRTFLLEATFGVVTVASPLTVRFNGTAAADAVVVALANEDYTPTMGDEVLILKVGAAWMVWGSYA